MSVRSDATAYKMVCEAIRLFRIYYGDYPKQVGLDHQTRHREYSAQHGWYWRTIEMNLRDRLKVNVFSMDLDDLSTALPLNYKRIEIPIEQLICTTPKGIPVPSPDTVWCEWGNTTAKMDIWFTDQGEHSIIWDEDDEEREKRYVP